MTKEMLVSYCEGRLSPPVLDSFKNTPREKFVLSSLTDRAYEDNPLPILRGKTISQPSTVLVMTEALQLHQGLKILEVGTGSGYQASIMGNIIKPSQVYTTEVIPELVQFAKNNIAKVKLKNITVIEHDGSQGLPEHAPFDRIIMTAACPDVPNHLLDQLSENGILLAPVGTLENQQLIRIIKHNGIVEQESLGEFLFSPLVGKHGFDEEKVT